MKIFKNLKISICFSRIILLVLYHRSIAIRHQTSDILSYQTNMDVSLKTQIVCRICYSNESKETLANWCNCSGTMGLMHKSCLERWLLVSNSKKCEICNYQFDIRFEIVKPTFKQVINLCLTIHLIFLLLYYNNYKVVISTQCVFPRLGVV